MDLHEAAEALYRLPPADFTRRRDELSRDARGAGDRELAGSISKLRKPTASAWLMNLLAQREANAIERLVELGEGMRAAQERLDGGELRRFSNERRGAVEDLVATAGRLGEELSQPVTGSVAAELRGTLEAMTADPDAAEAGSSGQLTRALSYTGLGIDLDGAVAVARPARPDRAAGKGWKKSPTARPAAPAKADRERSAAVRQAEKAVKESGVLAEQARREAEDAERELDRVRERVARVSAELADLRAAERAAAGRFATAKKKREATSRAARSAEAALRKARG